MPVFRSSDGFEIFYASTGCDELGPPVLLHHGFGASGEIDWVSTGAVATLTAAGRRVLTVDARGHGRSAKPHDPACYGISRMADDVRTLLDLLDIRQVDLVGYSMGAVVALVTAARESTAAREPRIRRLVVGGIGAGAVESGGLDTRALPPAALGEALLTEAPDRLRDPLVRAFRDFADSTGTDRIALAAITATLPEGWLPLQDVLVPTLVIAGRDDPLATRPQVLVDALPDATMHLLDGDHGAVIADPAFVHAVVSFLAMDL